MKMLFVYFYCCCVIGKIFNFLVYYLYMKFDVMSLISVNIMFSVYKLILFLLFIGIFIGGNDVVVFFDVGVVNYKVIFGLMLYSGYSYYVIVKGIYNYCIFNSRIMNFE